MIKRIAVLVLATAASAAVSAAGPQAPSLMYKCVDAKGKTYYTQVPPTECLGRSNEELSRTGRVVRQNEVLTPEQEAAREAERKKRVEAERLASEERRKNAALLNTYSSERDVEEARTRTLKQAEEAIKASEAKIAQAQKRRVGFEREKEFYVKKPMPAKLQQDIQENELSIRKEHDILEAKKKEMSTINAKYDDDKRRYVELTRNKK